jgi:hypothetical protein
MVQSLLTFSRTFFDLISIEREIRFVTPFAVGFAEPLGLQRTIELPAVSTHLFYGKGTLMSCGCS